ncbi:MAG: M55 family metallopeptidase [Bryobacteraceae bacterium]
MIKLPALFSLALAACAAPGPRILIVTDMEGVGGVYNWDEQTSPGQRRWDEARRLLTGEVNAAVDGAYDARAGQVVVWDGHGGSRALSLEDLHPRAELIQGPRTPPDYYMGESHYDAVMIVGQHAMAQTKGGLMAHTQSLSVSGIYLNGRAVGELGQIAAIAGHFGAPVIFLSGDRPACEELRQIQPKAETVAVKWMAGTASAHSLPHAQAKALIREHARRAVERLAEFQPWRIQGPVEMRIEFFPGKDGKTPEPRVYQGATVLETYQRWMGR